MTTNLPLILRRLITGRCMLAAALFILACAGPTRASAQWTAGDTKNAWDGYLSAYQYTGAAGYDYLLATTIGGSSHDGFWQSAEEIDMAVDAYVWAETNDSGNLSTYENEVEGLCDGFVSIHPDSEGGGSWASEDSWNDDLNVATIAFIRAYKVTGTTRWLTDAEDSFNAVWGRAQEGNGGLCEGPNGCYENSSANWTFVIAGHLIYNYNGNTGSYASDAGSVFNWAIDSLYDSSTGEIYDATGGVTGNYSYNYGYAIGAMSESGESATVIGQVATYLFNDMLNYAGTTSGGYNILPNYGQGATDNDGGYNGIVMRWINTANAHGSIPSADLAAAKANVTQAWSIREYSSGDPYYLMWDNWAADTNVSDAYSWDCSSALVGMLDGQGW
jgi:hypothetical protein